MSKIILNDLGARKKIEEGMTKASNIVASTIGPKGLNVIIGKSFGTPDIVNDGITVLKEIEFDNPFENMGVDLLKESSQKTNDNAGDGTTSTCILTSEILKEGYKSVASGANGIYIKKGIDKAVHEVVGALKSKAIPVDNEIEQIATVSSNNPVIGKYIAEAINKVGKEGVITLEDGKTNETYVDIVKGMQYDRGMLSPYFATMDNPKEITMEDATVVIVNDNIKTIQEFIPVIETAMTRNKPILLIANEVSQEILSTLVLNKVRGIIDIVVVKSPGFGENRTDLLNDIAVFSNGSVLDSNITDFKTVTANMFGEVKKVVVTKDSFTLYEGTGEDEAVKSRIKKLKTELNESTSTYDKAKLNERIAKLSGGIAVIYVGATTETEQKEVKLRIEDALNATKSAIEEGIVAGGGVALASCVHILNTKEFENDDVKTGYNIIRRSLTAPLKNIIKNAGLDEMILSKVLYSENGDNWGINAVNGEYVDMIKEGIIDPVKVVRIAIQNASSIAGMVLTSNVAIAIKPEKEDTSEPVMPSNFGI